MPLKLTSLPRFLALCGVLAAGLASWSGPIQAQPIERRVPTQNELRLSYAPVVKGVAPAVVNVYAAKVVRNRNPLFDDPIFRRFFGVPGGGGEQVQRSLGSGVIVDPSGLIVTNIHVIEGADEVKVALADKREFEAEIVLKDKRSDLAVLRIKDAHERFPFSAVRQFRCARGRRRGARHRQSVRRRADGDARHRLGARAHAGRHHRLSVLHPDRCRDQSRQFRRRAGRSSTGRLVGINTAIFSRSGGSQGIGFAIPANMVRVVVASARNGGTAVKRPWLGAKLQAVTPEIADSLGLKRPAGALVAERRAARPGRRRPGSRPAI